MKLVVRTTLWTMVAAGSLVCPRESAAQRIPSPFAFIDERQEIGPYVGYMSASTGRFGYGPSGGLMVGGRYAIDLSGPLSLEAVAGVVRGTRDVVNPARPEGDRVIGEADVLLTTLDARLRLSATGARTWHGLYPFLSFGAGVVFDTEDPSLTETAVLDGDEVFELGTKFMATVGPGIKWHVTRHLAVRTDLGFSLWKLDAPSGWGDPTLGLSSVAESEWVSALSLTGSVLFRW
ncbi:MAG: hypothetical protein AB7T31_08545 [Gemmatimonadales bacterium]